MISIKRLFSLPCNNFALSSHRQIFGIAINNLIQCTKYKQIPVAWTHDLVAKEIPVVRRTAIPVNKFTHRTHTCGELTKQNVGEHVQLAGWMEYQRMGKFITLRDAYGCTQLIIPEGNKSLQKTVEALTYESVLSATGKVVARPDGQQNEKMATGDIEVLVTSLEVLNTAMKQLPFFIRNHNVAKESLQMTYRYLSLRYPEMQRNLRIRSRLIAKMREYLINECDFVDVETPTLFRRTPGGAQEFVVPTRHADKFYALVQSPQQLKQLLMVGGIDRYFQVARCYRDEGSRADRQPEFTQLDLEMSFAGREEVMGLIEDLIAYCWPEHLKSPTLPFERMNYSDAIEFYGTDQPDFRIPYKLQNLTGELIISSETEHGDDIKNADEYYTYALVFPNVQEFLSKHVKTQFVEIKDKYFSTTKLLQLKIGDNSWSSQLNRLFRIKTENIENLLNLSKGDILFVSQGHKDNARQLLGKLRVEFTNVLETKGQNIRSMDYKFLWITDFPLFSYNNKLNKLESTHHPFTQPHPEDEMHLFTEPQKVRGMHYDLVLNGSEIGGGSVRVHNADLQRRILQLLQIDENRLMHMINALDSGAPPHSGIALGLDRFLSILCNTPSIRNVIAFPKTMEGHDLMSGAPSTISEEEKELYHITVKK